MRRGTPAAYEFGKWLKARRTTLGLSMRTVGAKIGVSAATISQVESGQRALKEPKIPTWAKALEINEASLRREWDAIQQRNPDGPIVRRRRKTISEKTLEERLKMLTGNERQQVLGYIDCLIESRET